MWEHIFLNRSIRLDFSLQFNSLPLKKFLSIECKLFEKLISLPHLWGFYFPIAAHVRISPHCRYRNVLVPDSISNRNTPATSREWTLIFYHIKSQQAYHFREIKPKDNWIFFLLLWLRFFLQHSKVKVKYFLLETIVNFCYFRAIAPTFEQSYQIYLDAWNMFCFL